MKVSNTRLFFIMSFIIIASVILMSGCLVSMGANIYDNIYVEINDNLSSIPYITYGTKIRGDLYAYTYECDTNGHPTGKKIPYNGLSRIDFYYQDRSHIIASAFLNLINNDGSKTHYSFSLDLGNNHPLPYDTQRFGYLIDYHWSEYLAISHVVDFSVKPTLINPFYDQYILNNTYPNFMWSDSYSWRYDLYLDNQSLFSGLNELSYNRFKINITGKHTWMVRDYGHGAISYSSEIWPFYVYPESPVLYKPADKTYFGVGPVDFRWYSVADAQAYTVTIDGKDYPLGTATSTSVDLSGISSGSHTWSVKAFGRDGTYSRNNNSFTFTIVPPYPILISPTSGHTGSLNHGFKVTFNWQQAANAKDYNIYITLPSGITECYTIDGLSKDYNCVTVGTYIWQVKAVDSNSVEHSGNQIWSFTVKPQPPILIFPAKNAHLVPGDMTFSWENPPGGGAVSNQFNIINSVICNIPTNVNSFTTNLSGGSYKWFVKAFGDYNTLSDSAEPRYLQIDNDGSVFSEIDGWNSYPHGCPANLMTGRVVAGDFDGDGKIEIAALYDDGRSYSRVLVWKWAGSSFVLSTGWNSYPHGCPANLMTGRVVAGDFDGDGKSEIAALYDDGRSYSRVLVWKWAGSSFVLSTGWNSYPSGCPGRLMTDRVVAGDFDGDGKSEIAALYDDGNSYSRVLVWKWAGSSFVLSTGWNSYPHGCPANLMTGRVVAGDFDGDGKSEIAALYDDGRSYSRVLVWKWAGSSFVLSTGWNSYPSGCPGRLMTDRVVAGDFDGDGKSEIAALYDDGNSYSRVLVWKWTSSSFTMSTGWNSYPSGCPGRLMTDRVVAGDFDGDEKVDLSALYDDGNSYLRILFWKSYLQ